MSDGYQFVGMPDRVRRVRREAAVHDRRVVGALSGTLDVTFCTEQPVHVGSGFKVLRGDLVVRGAAEVRGAPGVPGSSLKGVIRSRFEALTASCAGPPPAAGKARSRSYPDVDRASFTEEVRRKDVFHVCGGDLLCAACALFGRMSQRSRVAVADFAAEGTFVIEALPEQFGPNGHHLGDFKIVDGDRGKKRFEVYKLKGRKFAAGRGPVAPNARLQRVEAIPPGTLVRGAIRVFNLLPEELGGLLAALGRLPASALKIGAGKGQGFGRIALRSLVFRLQDHARVPVVPDEAAWRRAFEACPDRWATGEAELVNIHQGNC